MSRLNPATQYADDRNLRARQRLWDQQSPAFDLTGWVLGLVDIAAETVALDVGCGNGAYLRALLDRGASAVGCDLSLGMLGSARPHPMLVNANVVALPFADDAFGLVLAPHMLYHVPERERAAHELRRVLRSDGTCIVVTNGASHTSELRALVEDAVRVATPGWEMRNPSTHVFSLENGARQLRAGFGSVSCVRAVSAPVQIRDAGIVADYVASVADHYAVETTRPWAEVVADVRAAAESIIHRDGAFVVHGDVGAFICR